MEARALLLRADRAGQTNKMDEERRNDLVWPALADGLDYGGG